MTRRPFPRASLVLGPLAVLAATALSNRAAAVEPPPGPPQPPVVPRVEAAAPEIPAFSLTISPLHLIGGPILELTGELRVHDKIGVALVAGAGRITDNIDDGFGNTTKLTASVFEVGAQVRGYVVGNFRHGMQVGAELLYLHLSTDEFVAKGEGIAVGPFLGYKIATRVGFTFDAQLGVEYVGARASASDSQTSVKTEDSSVIPLLNLNVGWSF